MFNENFLIKTTKRKQLANQQISCQDVVNGVSPFCLKETVYQHVYCAVCIMCEGSNDNSHHIQLSVSAGDDNPYQLGVTYISILLNKLKSLKVAQKHGCLGDVVW